MNFKLISKDIETLNAAVACVKETSPEIAWKRDETYDERGNIVPFYVSLEEEEGIEFLENLLNKFPKLDISMEYTFDVEGRDSSWWRSYSYKSVTEPDGSRHMEYQGGSTGWC